VDVGGQGSTPAGFFGTEYRPKDPSYFVIPIDVLAGLGFYDHCLDVLGLGQVMGRDSQGANQIIAYTINSWGAWAGLLCWG